MRQSIGDDPLTATAISITGRAGPVSLPDCARAFLGAFLDGGERCPDRGVYEWCHFLIHTPYRPKSRYYRTIWRSRLSYFASSQSSPTPTSTSSAGSS